MVNEYTRDTRLSRSVCNGAHAVWFWNSVSKRDTKLSGRCSVQNEKANVIEIVREKTLSPLEPCMAIVLGDFGENEQIIGIQNLNQDKWYEHAAWRPKKRLNYTIHGGHFPPQLKSVLYLTTKWKMCIPRKQRNQVLKKKKTWKLQYT